MSYVVRDYTMERVLFTAHAHNNWAGCVCATTPRRSKRGVELREAQRSGHYKVRNGPTWLQVYNTVVLFRSQQSHAFTSTSEINASDRKVAAKNLVNGTRSLGSAQDFRSLA